MKKRERSKVHYCIDVDKGAAHNIIPLQFRSKIIDLFQSDSVCCYCE